MAGPEIAAPEPFIDIKRMPRWAKRASAELILQGHPGITIEHFQHPSPKSIGYILGQKWANYSSAPESTDMLNRLADQLENDAKMLEKQLREKGIVLTLHPSALLSLAGTGRLLEQGNEQVLSNYPSFLEILHEAFRAALEQPRYKEAVEFFRGFTGGIGNPGARNGKPTANTSATPIYTIIALRWPDIRMLRSLIELRAFLITAGIPESLVGPQKRLEKLCQRIGLRLASRGRPKRQK